MAYNIPFHILTGISVGLLIASFIVDPLGVIDPSVLAGVGEIFGFAALYSVVRAVDKGGVAKVSHHDTHLEIKNQKQPEEEKLISRD